MTDKALGLFNKIGLFKLGASASEARKSFASVSDASTRQAFLATARSVINYNGQTVNATPHFANFKNLQALLVWGEEDTIIPTPTPRTLAPNYRWGGWRSSSAPDISRTLTTRIASTASSPNS